MPPSRATNQYPRPVAVGAIENTGWFSLVAPMEPKNRAEP